MTRTHSLSSHDYIVILNTSAGLVPVAVTPDLLEAKQIAHTAHQTHGGDYRVARECYRTGGERWAEFGAAEEAAHE